MFTWKEGQEFSLDEPAGWHALTLGPGMVIEVLLPSQLTGGKEDIWAGFLVVESVLTDGLDCSVVVTAKSLGCSDGDIAKQLSSWFNRRAGQIHLCMAPGCTEFGECVIHATRVRTFSAAGFQRSYMTAASMRQLRKWQQDLGFADEGLGGEEDTPELPGGFPLRETAGGEERREKDAGRPGFPPEPVPEERKTSRRKKAREDSGFPEEERKKLRERLEEARTRMTGRLDATGAGKTAEPLIDVEAAIELSSSEGYSPSPGVPEVKEEGALPRRRKKKDKPVALDLGGPRRALALQGAALRRPGALRKKVAPLKETPELPTSAGVLALQNEPAATSGGTTSSLQKQLMARAAETMKERKDRKKEKKGSKDPGKQLALILTKVIGKKSKKGKKKRKRKKKRGLGPGGPPGDSSGSSGGSQSSSSGGGYGSDSGEESTTSNASKKMEPPLKRKAMSHPGSVLRMLVEHAREKLDQTAKVAVGRKEDEDATSGVRLTSYYALVVKAQLPGGAPQLRELHLLAHALDVLRSGELDTLGDLLASRFVSLHQARLDGNWNAAKHLEMIPFEESSAAGAAIVLQARKHAKLAAQVAGNEPRPWGNFKGKGRGRGAWDDGQWTGDQRGKGKKGDKGRGRGKGNWKGAQGSEGVAEGKNREKVPDK